MKRILFYFIAILFTALLHAQEPLTKSQQEVQQSVIQMFDALSNRDSVGLKAYCTTDIALFENGAIWNFDTLIKKAITLNKSKDLKRINKIDFINTTIDKNISWATYHLHSENTRGC